ncbi:MAG: hypothetical protein OHK005_20230 [Candidatus Methylacidiphilales bacterium]
MGMKSKLLALGMVWWLAWAPSGLACPGCKDNVNSSGPGQASAGELTRLERGYSYSVLFLLAVPAGLIGGLAVMISKECRRISQRHL